MMLLHAYDLTLPLTIILDIETDEIGIQTEEPEMKDSSTQTKADLKELAAMLIDPNLANNGVFIVKGDKKYFSKTSVMCLADTNPIRICLVHIIVNPWFDHFITMCIIVNSIMLASRDNSGNYIPDYESDWNSKVDIIDNVFTVIYILEFLLKVIAMGFSGHRLAYMSDPWNKLDFAIVLISILNFVPAFDPGFLKALRAARVLRPLKSISKLQAMKVLMSTIVTSMSGLLNVCVFLSFVFGIFAILGLHMFNGAQYNFCRETEEIIDDGISKPYWPIHPDAEWLCSSDETCRGYPNYLGDETVAKCGNLLKDYGLDPREYDNTKDIEDILYDAINFNNMGLSMLTIFESLTLDGWSIHMYIYQDSTSSTGAAIFFIFVVLLGSFIAMNLVLAEIMHSFLNEDEKNKNELAVQARKKMFIINQLRASTMKNKSDNTEKEEPTAPETNQQMLKDSRQSPFEQSVKSVQINKVSPLQLDSHRINTELNLNDDIQSDEPLGQLQFATRPTVDAPERHDQNSERVPEKDSTTKIDDSELTPEERRAKLHCAYAIFYCIIVNPFFNFVIYLLIFCSSLTLAVYSYDQTQAERDVIEILDYCFTSAFVIEMICKLIGLGPRLYIKDLFNILDAFIVLISVADIVLFNTVLSKDDGSLEVSAIMALRLLRVMRLARIWKQFQTMLKQIKSSIRDTAIFSLLLFVFLFIFSLLGMELFSYQVFYSEEEELIVGTDSIYETYEESGTTNLISPVRNFDTIGSSMLHSFALFIGDDWYAKTALYIRAGQAQGTFSMMLAYFFFVCLIISGHVVLQALLTALLLKNFEQSLHDEAEEKNELQRQSLLVEDEDLDDDLGQEEKLSCNRCKKRLLSLAQMFNETFTGNLKAYQREQKAKKAREKSDDPKNKKINKTGSTGESPEVSAFAQNPNSHRSNLSQIPLQVQGKDEVNQAKPASAVPWSFLHYNKRLLDHFVERVFKMKSIRKDPPLTGRSLWLLSATNPVRKQVNKLVIHPAFGIAIMVCIVISTVTLAFEEPLEDPNSEKRKIIGFIDYVTTTIFTIEAMLKIIALGFLFNGKRSYLRDSWNQLDFLIVVSGLISITTDSDIGFFKVLRILRVLRPLRLITRVRGLKLVIQALLHALPRIFNLQLVVIFFMYTFAILLTTLFSGKNHTCVQDHLSLSNAQELIRNKWDCINYGGEWEPTYAINFDGTLQSMLLIYIIQSGERYEDIYLTMIDANGIDLVTERRVNYFYALLHTVLVLLFTILFFNMFVGVVIEVYKKEQERITKNHLLNRDQKMWVITQGIVYAAKPEPVMEEVSTGSKLRDACIRIAKSDKFDVFIIVCILANTVVLACHWFNMSHQAEQVITGLNMTFNGIFTLEAILKIYALRCQYFKDAWNIYDFTIVVTTYTFLILEAANIFAGLGATTTILRALRVGRIIRLVKKAKQIKVIIHTLAETWQSLGSLGILLLLFLFTFSVIGCSLFGKVQVGDPQEELNVHANFQSFSAAFITLIRCSTGEDWDIIMFDLARSHSITFQCYESQTYDEIQQSGGEPFTCGSPASAYIFFILFQVIVTQVFLNLFIAIIVDSFLGQTDLQNAPIQQYNVRAFESVWQKYDPAATGFIAFDKLPNFLVDLTNSEDAKVFVLLSKEQMTEPRRKDRLIAELELPLYKNMSKVFFYDVIVKLAFSKYYMFINKNDMYLSQVFGQGGQKEVDIYEDDPDKQDDNQAPSLTKTKLRKSMGLVNNFKQVIAIEDYLFNRVELCNKLMVQARNVASKYQLDFEAEQKDDILPPEEETGQMFKKLEAIRGALISSQTELKIYTTLHNYCVRHIQRNWRAKKAQKLQGPLQRLLTFRTQRQKSRQWSRQKQRTKEATIEPRSLPGHMYGYGMDEAGQKEEQKIDFLSIQNVPFGKEVDSSPLNSSICLEEHSVPLDEGNHGVAHS